MPDLVPIKRALISVSDKTGVVEFARALAARGVEIISTGGTAKALSDAGVRVIPIEEVTKFPEMMDGRLKTLHPMIHGGILAVRDNAQHLASMKQHGITPIDLVCVNLYPFEETVAKPGVTLEEAIENIDIGGPTMIRAAAKNWEWVTVVVSPMHYKRILNQLDTHNGATSRELRFALAECVFGQTDRYDGKIRLKLRTIAYKNSVFDQMPYLLGELEEVWMDKDHQEWREQNRRSGRKSDPDGLNYWFLISDWPQAARLRYGENPHQRAAVYKDRDWCGPSLVSAEQLHGKELSYNNLNDAAAAMALATDLARLEPNQPGAVVVKHTNPCGAAVAGTVAQAIDLAMIGDPLAAYGGILFVNQPIDLAGAKRLCREGVFLEVIVAPSFAPEAAEALKLHSKMVRLLALRDEVAEFRDEEMRQYFEKQQTHTFKRIPGGLLVQTRDDVIADTAQWQHKAGPAPTSQQLRDAAVIETIAKHLTSNAIAIGGREPTDEGDPLGYGVRLFGAGAGQMDRVNACRIAIEKAGPLARVGAGGAPGAGGGAIAASDAFFPFPDGPELLINAGVKVIVHPGGSKRDDETFSLCERKGVTCLVTGVRHFRH